MREKNLIIVCLIFAVLVGLVFVKKNMKLQVPTAEEVVDIIAPSLSIDDVTEVVLRLGDGSGEDKDDSKNVRLAKEGERWVVKTQYGVYANDKVIAPVLDRLDRLKGELRSDKSELFDDYGISNDKALHVLLKKKDGTVHLVVGLKKAGYQNNFVRLGGANAVYIVNENLLAVLGLRGEGEDQKLDTDKWTDKRIAHIDIDRVEAVTIMHVRNGKEEKVIDIRKEMVEGKTRWQSGKPYAFGLSASKIRSMIAIFNNAYAREVVAPDVQGVFDAPEWIGVFTLEGGDQVRILRGAKDVSGDNYYVKQEGAGYFYLVPVFTFDSRQQQQGNIFANSPLNVKEDNVDEIEIRDVNSKKVFHVLKKSSEPGETSTDEAGDQEAEQQDIWQMPGGESVEVTKVREIIDQIRGINPEMIPQPDPSLKNTLTIRIVKEEESKEYMVSQDMTLDSGKECHILKVDGQSQGYCVSKPQITALRNALP